MNRVFVAGVVATVTGLAGYVLGLASPYPGRAFAVTLVMAGITLVAVRHAGVSP